MWLTPILLGDETKIKQLALANAVDLEGIPILNPKDDAHEEWRKKMGDIFLQNASAAA
ncbi:MAG: hypothetical protein WDM90_02585 [Ferruginibacter sp.]